MGVGWGVIEICKNGSDVMAWGRGKKHAHDQDGGRGGGLSLVSKGFVKHLGQTPLFLGSGGEWVGG